MKQMILIILVLGLTAGFAFAQERENPGSQWDIYLHIPYMVGIHTDDADASAALDYTFLVPEVNWHYYFGTEKLHLGVGLDLFTLIVESLVMPSVAVETFQGPFVLTGRVAGGAFLLFGLVNYSDFGSLFLPEVSATFRFGEKKQFGLGTAVKFMIAPDVAGMDNFAFIGTVFGRWTL